MHPHRSPRRIVRLARVAAAATLLAALVPVPSSGADPRAVQVGEQTILLPAPGGYCPVDRRDPAQNAVIAQIEAAGGRNVRMLTFDVACAALDAFKAQGGGSLSPYLIQYAVLENGAPARFGGSAGDFVRHTLTQLDGLGASVGSAAMAERLAELAQAAGQAPPDAPSLTQRALGHDDHAVYVGFVSRGAAAAGPEGMAGVTGMTVVDGLVATINMYRDYRGRESLETLLDETRAQVAAVAAANGS